MHEYAMIHDAVEINYITSIYKPVTSKHRAFVKDVILKYYNVCL